MNEPLPSLSIARRLPRSLHHFVVWQKVAGADRPELPVLYVDDGPGKAPRPMTAMVDFVSAHPGLSRTWLLYRVRAVGTFLDYVTQTRPRYAAMALSHPNRNIHRTVVRDYTRAMVRGTVSFGDSGLEDATGLFWLPVGVDEAERRLQALRDVARWLDTENYGDVLAKAALREIPSDPSGSLNFLYAAQVVRRVSMLDYLSPYKKVAAKSVRDAQGRKASSGVTTFMFPPRHVIPLLDEGFRTRGGREDASARLLTMLMLFGGIRGSEGLHLWTSDFQAVEGEAAVFLYHPSDSKVLDDGGASVTRREHLKKKYGINPRSDALTGPHAAGWKGVKGDGVGAPIYWLPIPGLAKAMAAALRSYLAEVRAPAMRLRRGLGLPDHPFLLVSTGHVEGRAAGGPGNPYTMSAFRASWSRAIGRLGRATGDPALAMEKALGTTPHACRHFYAKNLEKSGLDGAYLQECLHHMSPFSHLAYKRYSAEEVNDALNAALVCDALPDWGAAFGFKPTSQALAEHRNWKGAVR